MLPLVAYDNCSEKNLLAATIEQADAIVEAQLVFVQHRGMAPIETYSIGKVLWGDSNAPKSISHSDSDFPVPGIKTSYGDKGNRAVLLSSSLLGGVLFLRSPKRERDYWKIITGVEYCWTEHAPKKIDAQFNDLLFPLRHVAHRQ